MMGGLFACSQPLTVEQQIIAEIRDMEASIENRGRRAFMGHVADEFLGQDGMTTRQQLNALILYHLNRNKQLQAQLFPINVNSTSQETAEAYFRILITGGSGWLPERGQMYEITTHWEIQDGDWKLVRANWETTKLPVVIGP
jgi:hypothetical protein